MYVCPLCNLPPQIEEVALVTEKGSSRRRGFIFVTFLSEESVDKCTKQTFHVVQESQVSPKDFLLYIVFCPSGGSSSICTRVVWNVW